MYIFFSIGLSSLSTFRIRKTGKREDEWKIEYKRQLAFARAPIFPHKKEWRDSTHPQSTHNMHITKTPYDSHKQGEAMASSAVRRINNSWCHKLTKGIRNHHISDWLTGHLHSFNPAGLQNYARNKYRKAPPSRVNSFAGIARLCVCVLFPHHISKRENGAYVSRLHLVKQCIAQL